MFHLTSVHITDTYCHMHCLEEFLLSLYERGESSYCLIIGDLNARIEHWNNAGRDSDLNDNEEVNSRNSRDNYINTFIFKKYLSTNY